MKEKAVILLSGGIDSATALAEAGAAGHELYALTFRYGQRHAVEVSAAERVARAAGTREHRVLDLDPRAFQGSVLTGEGAIPDQPATGIPPTYVPARNTIFLSYALGWAEAIEARHIYIGVTTVDYSGYPDCRPEYIEAFRRLAALATREAVEGDPVQVHAPLIHLGKAAIIRRGTALGVDYSLTHSCYDPDSKGLACGRCDSCRHRRAGFREAGISDPTRYVAPAANSA